MNEEHTRTVTLEFDNHDDVNVTLTAPGQMVTMMLLARAPDFEESGCDELFTWGGVLVRYTSDLESTDVTSLTMNHMVRLTTESVALIRDAYFDDDSSDYRIGDAAGPLGDIELNDDGTIDLEDMQ